MINLTAINTERLINAIKNSVPEGTVSWAVKCTLNEQDFCETNGVGTHEVAKALNIDANETRKQLDKLAKKGLIFKSKRNAGSFCRWWPKGLMAEIKSQHPGATS